MNPRLLLSFADRKSTRLNSSHLEISYAVFCLKKKDIRGVAPLPSCAMSSPYNPPPCGQQPGEQPQWGGYPGGANHPQQDQPGYSGQGYQQGGYQQGGYQQGSYPQQGGYQQANYPQQQGGYGYQQGAQQSWGGSGYGSQD